MDMQRKSKKSFVRKKQHLVHVVNCSFVRLGAPHICNVRLAEPQVEYAVGGTAGKIENPSDTQEANFARRQPIQQLFKVKRLT